MRTCKILIAIIFFSLITAVTMETIWAGEALFPVVLNNKSGFMDKTGKIIIPPQFEYALPFSEGLAKVGVDGKLAFVDTTGKIIILKYTNDRPDVFSEGFLKIRKGKKWGFIDEKGNLKIGFQFYKVSLFKEGLAWAKVNMTIITDTLTNPEIL